MNPKQQLKSILNNEYESEDGDLFKIELLNGMSKKDIQEYKKHLPNNSLPSEIEELLEFCKGFEFFGMDEVRFDSFGHFGFEEVFPNSVQLAGDGFGNFWILDIDSKGNWNSVYYVCHDPAVIIKQSENLSEFIEQINEFGISQNDSILEIIHEQVVWDIWSEKLGGMLDDGSNYNLKSSQLPESFLIADLNNKPIKTGFSWAISGPKTIIVRPTDDPIWIVENKVKQSFFSRLFGKKKSKASA